VPLTIANDADLGGLAEHARGAGRATSDMVYLQCEVGIGAGIIAGGRPLEGTAGCAGEVGHLVVNPGGLQCRCGAVGCWETEAGEMALLRHAGRGNDSSWRASVSELLAEAARDDPSARAAVQTVGQWLGIGIASLVNIFNPELVVLGGFFSKLYPHVEMALREQVRTRAMAPARNFVNIVPAMLGPDAALLGAAELALEPMLADPTMIPARR
jgi:predicted NBD/HSP70 family sugar kinase